MTKQRMMSKGQNRRILAFAGLLLGSILLVFSYENQAYSAGTICWSYDYTVTEDGPNPHDTKCLDYWLAFWSDGTVTGPILRTWYYMDYYDNATGQWKQLECRLNLVSNGKYYTGPTAWIPSGDGCNCDRNNDDLPDSIAYGSNGLPNKICCSNQSEICCNGIDDNCNGQVDEGCDPCACPSRPCYCNSEVCCDGIDNNCNGQVDEGCDRCLCNPDPCCFNPNDPLCRDPDPCNGNLCCDDQCCSQ